MPSTISTRNSTDGHRLTFAWNIELIGKSGNLFRIVLPFTICGTEGCVRPDGRPEMKEPDVWPVLQVMVVRKVKPKPLNVIALRPCFFGYIIRSQQPMMFVQKSFDDWICQMWLHFAVYCSSKAQNKDENNMGQLIMTYFKCMPRIF